MTQKVTKESIKKTLDERKKADNEQFKELTKLVKELRTSEDSLSEKNFAIAFELLLKEIHDLNMGLNGSYEFVATLIDDRNKIGKWIKNFNEDKEFLMELLEVITKKLDGFDDFINKNKDSLKDVEDVKKSHKTILEFRDELLKIAEKRKNEPPLKLSELPDYIK